MEQFYTIEFRLHIAIIVFVGGSWRTRARRAYIYVYIYMDQSITLYTPQGV